MGYMTRIENCPDRDQAKAGMAFFAGTGPPGKTCGSCESYGYDDGKHSRSTKWKCATFKKLTGTHGPNIRRYYPSCKYFRQK